MGDVSNGSFGLGGSYNNSGHDIWIAGGGGGFYGGGASYLAPGAGGSGYISNSLLEPKYMVRYNSVPNNEITSQTYLYSNVSENPISDYAKMNNGYVRITKF